MQTLGELEAELAGPILLQLPIQDSPERKVSEPETTSIKYKKINGYYIERKDGRVNHYYGRIVSAIRYLFIRPVEEPPQYKNFGVMGKTFLDSDISWINMNYYPEDVRIHEKNHHDPSIMGKIGHFVQEIATRYKTWWDKMTGNMYLSVPYNEKRRIHDMQIYG